jgi:single-strand DNA-binding protein
MKLMISGNLCKDVELKTQEDGKPYALLRIASDRRYKDRAGEHITDFITVKVHGQLAEYCAERAYKGCKLVAAGDFETLTFEARTGYQTGFLLRAYEVEVLSPRKRLTGVSAAAPAEADMPDLKEKAGCVDERTGTDDPLGTAASI